MSDNTNGHGVPALAPPDDLSRRPLLLPSPSAPQARDGFAAAPSSGFVSDAYDEPEPLGFALRMEMPALLYGLGTTGARMMSGVVDLVHRELGRLPASMNYLALDGASKESARSDGHFLCIDRHGCGTVPRRGSEQFYRHYGEIRLAVDRQMQTVSPFDPEIPVFYSPREALDVRIFAGCGGASGGMLHPMISLVHDIAQLRRIRDLRVHVVLMGPDMPMRDSARSTHSKQVATVSDTFSGNLLKIIADMCSAAVLVEMRPNGTSFRLKAADRVWGLHLVDQSNAAFEWATTDGLTEMIAWQSFLEIFTHLGKFTEDRKKDLEQLNISARSTM